MAALHTVRHEHQRTASGQAEPEIVAAIMADSDLFATVAIQPLAGRAFSDPKNCG
jgi:hypothetical protein